VTDWVLHVDLDQFIAAVEVLRHPELAGRPVVVGGDGDPGKRGVVSTASYEARAFGVHSGMALRRARRCCPDAVFLPVDREAYEEVSAEVMATLRASGAVVQVVGWDEAFLGVSTSDPEGFARDLQARVKAATRLDCSVGIGQNKLQAKLATGFGKPAGVFRLTFENWFEVLGDRPTDALWGIGARTAQKLAGLGLHTVRELAAAEPGSLAAVFGPTTGPWLVLLANGRGEQTVDDTPYRARSHGREVTYQQDLTDWSEVSGEVARLAETVAAELAGAAGGGGAAGGNGNGGAGRDGAAGEGRLRPAVRVVVKVRFAPFITVTHGQPLAEPTVAAGLIRAAALAALERFTPGRPVRLLGVRAEFAPGPDPPRR
jgi:nucleotidyltransferase/DNA polymerase involved in DNA repair